MSFVFGAGYTNCDLLFSGLPSVPAEGTELYAGQFDVQIGGGPPATLINLKGLGVPVKMATFIGNSVFCEFIKAEYKRHGIDYVNLHEGGGMPLVVTAAIITPQDRTFVSYREDAPLSLAAMERLREISSGASLSMMGSQFLELHRQQKAAGATLVFDMGWEEDMNLEKYFGHLELADYYTPNRKEALKITGASNPEDAIDLLSEFFPKALIKLDKEGCLIKENNVKTIIPPLRNIAAVDATGAGDAFLAGFLYGLYNRYDFADCVRFGNITGGICVQATGCLGKQINESEMLALKEARYG